MGKCENREINNFINNYVRQLKNESATLFVGAGLSIGSGGINWSELLEEEAQNIGLDVNRENDLVNVAQYIYNESGTRNTISELIKNKISSEGNVNDNHNIISQLPIRKIWTTNYDNYIEQALIENNKKVDIKKSVKDISLKLDEADVSLFKMHGDVNIPESAVLIKDDYEIYDRKNEVFLKNLQADLLNNTFLFLGFSFEDPNLRNILSKVRIMLDGDTKRHYCIMKTVQKKDVDNEENYCYEKNKEKLFANDLLRYGIKVIFVNDYKEITNILEEIKRKFYANNVFISGAFETLDTLNSNIINRENVDEFCSLLGKKLYEKDFSIVQALSPGIGRPLISGFVNEELKQNKRKSKLKVRPFPIESPDNYYKYRKSIMSECGSIVYLFGNRWDEDENEIINSPGVRKEAEVAKELQLYEVYVDETGYMTQELAIENSVDYSFSNCTTIEEIVEKIMDMLVENRQRGIESNGK